MNTISETQFENFKQFINSHKAFVICGHKEPDGDCIASSLGLAKILDFYKKPYQILNAGPFKRTETKTFEKLFTADEKVSEEIAVRILRSMRDLLD